MGRKLLSLLTLLYHTIRIFQPLFPEGAKSALQAAAHFAM
jgi:hypothetical protein